MKKLRKLSKSDLFFAAFLLLLLVPQTRKPILVGVNKARVWALSPNLNSKDKQVQLTTFDYRLTDLAGLQTEVAIGKDNIIFLSYWATWCPPCIAELPSIQKLYKSYGKHIDFVLITKEDPAVVRQFLEKNTLDLPVYNPNMKTPPGLKDDRLPTSYLIGANGEILMEQTGATDWNSIKVRQVLDELLVAQIALD